ncbi:hypothetical protein AV654_17580 [Paenibacillus elgii]|uniref:Uncharacterized protein n=1 Tax=Paenibacillus elgii TaxID=189691 RepID=A0A165R6N7_9BACL|nr:hypothetical protein [Paenibacillus elgii]KZE79282.1 hypothetical protein AV654_17580 [Paenibacillus elgii]
MGSLSSCMRYDFKAARERREQLVTMYRSGRRSNPDDPEWGWDIVALIEEIDREIDEAHAKRAAGQGDSMEKQFGNLITPIVPHWGGSGNSLKGGDGDPVL